MKRDLKGNSGYQHELRSAADRQALPLMTTGISRLFFDHFVA